MGDTSVLLVVWVDVGAEKIGLVGLEWLWDGRAVGARLMGLVTRALQCVEHWAKID